MRSPLLPCSLLIFSLLPACDCWSNKYPGSCAPGADDSISPGACETAPTQALEVLSTYCAGCHGGGGSAEGGLGYITDAARLVEEGKVIPGDPSGSLLIQRLRSGSMPPAGSPAPSEAEIAAVEAWIDCGAQPFVEEEPRTFYSPEDLYAAMDVDLATVPELEQVYVRYISLAHLYNAGLAQTELELYRDGVSKLVNSLSWAALVVPPRVVDEAGVLLRIDLRDYRWESLAPGAPDKWELLVARYPYAFQHDDSNLRSVIHATGSRQPVLMGDWLVSAASEPPLYNEILGIPKTQAEYLALFGVDQAANVTNLNVARAGFADSGVSFHNRIVERHPSLYGYCWVSYDFAGSSGKQNIAEHPLDFEEDGGEVICSLPNHLQSYFIGKATGERLNEAPTAIVAYPDNNNVIVNGRSCMDCHAQGIIPKSDEILESSLKGGQSPADLLIIEAIYPPNAEMDALYTADRERFLAALEETGVDGVGTAEPVDALYQAFDEALTAERVAAEAEVTEEELIEKLPRLPDALSDLYRLETSTVDRDTWLLVAQDLLCNLHSGVPELDDQAGVCVVEDGCGGVGLACEAGQSCTAVVVDEEGVEVCLATE